ncbi:MAG: PadR family transcriptional regulator [Candidatus Hodarchaeales archaeon]
MSLEERLENELISNLITFLLLKCVKDSPEGFSYGYEMKKYVEERIKEQFDRDYIPEGTLYPILSKLADKSRYGCLESFKLEKGKRIRYYRLTKKGEQTLDAWPKKWVEVSKKLDKTLQEKE